jgi:hypothetical protein
MVCFTNISVDTLHKGDTDDDNDGDDDDNDNDCDDDDYDDDNNNNNNNNNNMYCLYKAKNSAIYSSTMRHFGQT